MLVEKLNFSGTSDAGLGGGSFHGVVLFQTATLDRDIIKSGFFSALQVLENQMEGWLSPV